MSKVTLSNGLYFTANDSDSLVDAAERAGIFFPYSCKTGRCSACKCKLLSGETSPISQEYGLTFEERRDGWILGCVRSVTTDVLLEVDDLNGIELPAIKTLPCRIFSLDLKSSNVLILKLRLPHAVELKYIPGQYINLIGQSGVRRSYSLANSIGEDKLLELHIRAVKGGLMSEYLFNEAKINDLMRLTGPFGTFFLRDITNKDVFFLATGTGIAPVKAILESLMSLGPDQGPKSVTVLWGGRVLEDFYFDIDSIPGKFNFVPVLSRGDVSWHGARGYVQHEFLKMQPNLSQSVVYACGSETMIRCAKKLLTQNGLPDSQFYSDAFVCSCSS